jgi:hypothetical protein
MAPSITIGAVILLYRKRHTSTAHTRKRAPAASRNGGLLASLAQHRSGDFPCVTAPAAGIVSSRSATIGVIGRSVVATTGSLPTGATPRRGTDEVVRRAGAVTASPDQHLRHHRVGRQLAIIAAQKIGFSSPFCGQRYSRPG